MSLQLINGQASESALDDTGAFFSGTVSPARHHISESLLDRADDFLGRFLAGRVDKSEVYEAFATPDFTLAIFATINSELMAKYDELPAVWRQYTTAMTVPDFRPTRLLDKWSDRLGLKRVPELTEYPMGGGIGHAVYWINVAKYGLRDAFSWESWINNTAIDEIQAAPEKYATAARETETVNALANLLNMDETTGVANGVNTDFFKAGNGNAPLALPMTAENVSNLLQQVRMRKVKDRLVVPPDLQIVHPKSLDGQAEQIKALIEIRKTEGDQELVYRNYLHTTEFVSEPMLDALNTHAKAATTWFVLPKPTSRRPATFAAFLRGHETPDMRYRADAGQRIGGGAVSPMEGSFDIDDIQTRVRHVLGHQTGDPTFTAVSLGS